MESLNLSIPEQHAYTDPTVERNVDRLRGWLTSLPLMDVVETERLVPGRYEAQLYCPSPQKYKKLELDVPAGGISNLLLVPEKEE